MVDSNPSASEMGVPRMDVYAINIIFTFIVSNDENCLLLFHYCIK